MNKLMKKIKKLENDTISKQLTLEQVTLSLHHCMTEKTKSFFCLRFDLMFKVCKKLGSIENIEKSVPLSNQ